MRQHEIILPVLSPAQETSLPIKIFTNKVDYIVAKNIGRNPPFAF